MNAEFSLKEIEVRASEKTFSGKMAYKEWPEKEAKKRALKKTLKIVGAVLGCSLIGLFVHILLVIIVPIVILTLLGAIPLFLKFSNERQTLYYVSAECPTCKKETEYRPYVGSRLSSEMTIQCPDCGETAQALIPFATQ